MRIQRCFSYLILLAFGLGALYHPQVVRAAPLREVSAFDLILAMNTLRVSYGLPALIEDPIVDALAQSTAATMAANDMSWHIGNVRGRLAAAGYGNGGTVWATENFAVGRDGMGIDEIMSVWADPDHMLPAVEAAYCNIGAGIATVNGKTYYILQAAYVGGRACGSGSAPSLSGGTPQSGTGASPISQLIVPVKVATPDADGKIYHVVQAGQSFWSIAITYQLTIHDLEVWNNLSRTTPLRAGQRLFIPGKDTQGFATPTPVGMVVTQTPDADGKIIHVVQPYQALITIADAYQVSVDRILQLNGLQADWPLSIDQKLVISPGNITPSPTLNALQRLTPEADGQYYHTVQSGETLLWIAGLYDVSLTDLMNWNGLNDTSIIRPGQPLLLRVTPPATPTLTPSPTMIPASPSPSITPLPPTETPPVTAAESSSNSVLGLLFVVIALIAVGGLLWWRFSRKK
ncbi:MAG: LysM peptidoglycan-binding domain-containing protein [Chloroflexota bacterium]